jgi:hypothetical protein
MGNGLTQGEALQFRIGCRARPRVGPFRVSGATDGTASRKVRPYNDTFAAPLGLESGPIWIYRDSTQKPPEEDEFHPATKSTGDSPHR